jgi:two-component sensor histidine kinase
VHITVNGDRIALATQQATTLAIVLNELLTNALRHAFHGRAEGSVAITHRALDRRAELTVADDGVGLPPGFDPERDQGLGLSIVAALTRQDLRGEFHLGPNAAGGTTVTLRSAQALSKRPLEVIRSRSVRSGRSRGLRLRRTGLGNVWSYGARSGDIAS